MGDRGGTTLTYHLPLCMVNEMGLIYAKTNNQLNNFIIMEG